ncbi:MAG: ferredoxin--NADP(+) reductase [SAR86 cluster bacterium]|uniref:ferredoxin--NADP(+) reductase n=1 Tax=SAR86 cluster bacterium TaxID=2030880 RepID=A0A2A5CC70_9GAMM|nr:ferredoxin--NADP reductase [Gammaproteobacteria bacterium AH-315-E17]PCJ41437.1 MAG: ferredoxin--NADP(+) reductase [SAR86 cluster bacterium]
MATWIDGKVVDNIHWHENLFSLKVEAEIEPFTAGQFTSLALEINNEQVARPYSFLSSPGQQPLEFFFYVATDGALSNALVKLNVGDKVMLKHKANGFFTLDEVPASRDLWMIGTGTGIAPYFSILGSKEVWQRYDNIVLVEGVRSSRDLPYQNLIEKFSQEHPDKFTFQAFVSREDFPNAIKSRIPVSLGDGSLEEKVGLKLSPADSQVMLCGNPDMVKSSVELLKGRGFIKNLRRKPGQITTENYW